MRPILTVSAVARPGEPGARAGIVDAAVSRTPSHRAAVRPS